jgi:membrane AbrB-like protein
VVLHQLSVALSFFSARPVWQRVVFTLALAWILARVCVALHTPIPWMIGPLVGVSLLSMLGAPTESWTPLRNTGQWVIGTALGLYFTPEVGALIAGLWWAIVLGVIWALALGLGFGAWLRRVHAGHLTALSPEQLRTTTYFSGAIGGASEMTLIAERQGARTDLVAAAHSLRVLMVTLTIPFAMQFWGVAHLDLSTPGVRDVHPAGLMLLAATTLVGALAMRRLGRANPWFMGALLVTMLITLTGVQLSAIPAWLSAAAQLLIGISLGVRFTPAFVHTAPRWLASVAFASVVMMGLCAVFGWVMAQFTGLHPATMILGTSPGGIAEMSITAKVLQLGVPVVTAFQVCRLLAVLVLVEPVYHWWRQRHQT